MNRWNPLSWFHRPLATPPEKRDVGRVTLTVELVDNEEPYKRYVVGYWFYWSRSGVWLMDAEDHAHDLMRRWHKDGVIPADDGAYIPIRRVKRYRVSEMIEYLAEASK